MKDFCLAYMMKNTFKGETKVDLYFNDLCGLMLTWGEVVQKNNRQFGVDMFDNDMGLFQ